MPAIAAGVRADGAAFYWHLGDYRAIYDFDQDYRRTHPKATIADYLTDAWPDFIQHQIMPFGELPVFLGIGNHELVPPKNQQLYIAQFADWLDQPVLQRQRLADNPGDHLLKTYYHWIERGVDFISMDNASDDMFDPAQMAWLKSVLANDAADSAIRTVVVGMHEALPDSFSAGHSMNESAQEQASGRKAYSELSDFRTKTKKNVYVLASHSHFVMSHMYDTACHRETTCCRGGSWAAQAQCAITCRPSAPLRAWPGRMFMAICLAQSRPTEASPSSSKKSGRAMFRPVWWKNFRLTR